MVNDDIKLLRRDGIYEKPICFGISPIYDFYLKFNCFLALEVTLMG